MSSNRVIFEVTNFNHTYQSGYRGDSSSRINGANAKRWTALSPHHQICCGWWKLLMWALAEWRIGDEPKCGKKTDSRPTVFNRVGASLAAESQCNYKFRYGTTDSTLLTVEHYSVNRKYSKLGCYNLFTSFGHFSYILMRSNKIREKCHQSACSTQVSGVQFQSSARHCTAIPWLAERQL